MGERLSRRALIAQRWRRVGSTAFLSFVLTFFVARIAHDKLEQIVSAPTWMLMVGLGTVAAIGTAMAPQKLVAALRIKHIPTYPPYWFGVAAGVAAGLYVITNTIVLTTELQLTADTRATLSSWSEFIGLAPLVSLIIAWVVLQFRTRGNETPTIEIPNTIKPNTERLMAWILTDSPVIEPEQDMFGHARVAAIVASRLVLKDPAPQAIIGPLGSGKTSIGKLVEKYLIGAFPEPPISFVHVELWPYATPRAAVEGLLQSLTDAFGDEINTSQLKGLPEAYGNAITKLAGISEWIPTVLKREPLSESEVLEAFDEIAIMIHRRFVLWIEDLERFGGGDPDTLPNTAELERLAPIRALLLRLGRLRAITVVTASTDLLRRFDIEKIAGYIEEVPRVGLHDAKRVIAALRKQWLVSANVIDAAPPAARQQLGWDEREYNPLTDWFALGDHVSDFATAVSALANTPRTLKQGLRAAHGIWKGLKGDIDLDDVLALCILRESHPNVFALIAKHIKPLRGEYIRNDREKDPLLKLKAMISDMNYEAQLTLAIQTILGHLFGPESRARPQGIANHGHADYWARFMAYEAVPKKQGDQLVLQTLAASENEPTVDLLLDEQTASAVQDFRRMLSSERVQSLLSVLVKRLMNLPPSKWSDRHAPGIVAIWNMIRDRRGTIDIQRLTTDIDAAIDASASKNIGLMQEIVYWFAPSSDNPENFFDKATRDKLMAKSQALLVQHYAGKPTDLVAQLRGAPAALLLQAVWGLDTLGRKPRGIPFPGWSALATTLVDALSVGPEVIAPQLSAFITSENPHLSGPDAWIFVPEQCEALFGTPDTLVEKLREALAGKASDPRSQAVIEKRMAPSM